MWDGARWAVEGTLQVFDLARQICREASAECNQASTAKKLADARTIAAVERLARADRHHAATVDQWDTDPWLLNTPSGMVDLKTGDLREQPLGQLGDLAVAKRAEFDLHNKVEALVVEKGGSYIDAFRAVMGAPKNKALVQCYVGLTLDKQAQDAEPDMSSQEAGLEIDSRAHSYMADHQTDYEAAYRAVLTAEPELKTAYGQA